MNDSSLVAVRPGRVSAPVSPQRRHVQGIGLAGTALAERFCFWRGRSGRRYVFSVYKAADEQEFDALPQYADAIVIAAERNRDGTRRLHRVAQTGGLPQLALAGSGALGQRGASNELHYHLLAGTAADRKAIVEDLVGADA